MDIATLPKTLTYSQVKVLRAAFGHFYDQEDTSKFVDAQTGFRFENVTKFVDYLYSPEIGIPKGTSAKVIGITLESWYETLSKAPEFSEPTMTAAPEYATASTTLTPDQLKQLEQEQKVNAEKLKKTEIGAKEAVETAKKRKEEIAKEALQKKAIENAKARIQAQIKEEQNVQETLQDKKIYAKVEIAKEAPPPDESALNFINEAKNHPASFEKDLAASIKAKMAPTLSKTLTEEEIGLIADKTASDTVYAIVNFPSQSSANTQAAILAALAKDPKILSKVIPTKSAIDLLQNSVNESRYFVNSTQLSKNILSSINPNLATAVFGVGPENLNATFFEQPVEGYTHEVDLGKFNEGHINLLESQSKVFDNISSFAGGEAKNFLMGQTRNFLDSQIAKLPADNAVAGFYNSEFGQQILNFAGLSKAAPLGENFLNESFLGGFIEQIPGGTAFLEGVGNFFGIDLAGVAAPAEIAEATLLTTEGTALVGEAALVEGGTLLAEGATGIVAAEGLTVGVEVGLVGAEATAAVAAAPATLGLSLIIGAIITAVTAAVGWIAKKINWAKIKENLIAISGGMLAAGLLIFPNTLFGTALSVTGGLGLVGGVMSGGLSTLGASLSGIGAGIAGAFGALGTAFVGAVATPILVTLLVFPVTVALILFIINAGAYVVPPAPVSWANGPPGPSAFCTTQKDPIGFANTASEPIAHRAWEISADLYQGFQCLWNRSPKAPPPYDVYFPNDTVEYPPSYPELFDYASYISNPNPASENGLNLFWCTWLIQKSYSSANDPILSTLWVPTMLADFTNRAKFVDSSHAAYQKSSGYQAVLPGSVVFFNIGGSVLTATHVAIVYSVNIDGFSYVQSNAFVKEGFIPFGQDGKGVQSAQGLGDWVVVGIGLP